MTKLVNKMLTAKTTTEYFKACMEVANELEQYSTTANDIFYQVNNNGLIDIVFDGNINFIIEGSFRTVDYVTNSLKWVKGNNPIKITKKDDNIIVKVVL